MRTAALFLERGRIAWLIEAQPFADSVAKEAELPRGRFDPVLAGKGGDTLGRLFAQPFSHMRLVANFFTPKELACQRIVIEYSAVRETAAAGAQRVNELADEDLGTITALLVFPRIQTLQRPDRFLQAETPRHRLGGH